MWPFLWWHTAFIYQRQRLTTRSDLKSLSSPLTGVHHQFPVPARKPCHILPPQVCQLSHLASSSLDLWAEAERRWKKGDMSTLFIFIHQVTSLCGSLFLSVHQPIWPIRGAGVNGGRRGWGSSRAVVMATRALMLLFYFEARETGKSRQRAQGQWWRREVSAKRSDRLTDDNKNLWQTRETAFSSSLALFTI